MSKDERVLLTALLTPQKIVLLALIAAYCAEMIPPKTSKLVLSLILKYIEGPSIENDIEFTEIKIPTLQVIIQDIEASCLGLDKANGETYFKEIESTLLHALWSLKSIESLHSFIARSGSLLVKNYREGYNLLNSSKLKGSVPKKLITKSSYLGSFIENCMISFELLEFDKVEILWKSFIDYRSSSKLKYYEISDMRLNEDIEDETLIDFFGSNNIPNNKNLIAALKASNFNKFETDKVVLLSQQDLTKIIDYEINKLELIGGELTPNLKEKLTSMNQQEISKIPLIFYLNYLESLKHLDYENSFKNLHRYFDYMMSNKHNVFYHYALLNLANLHSLFNSDNEAINAIEESISVARENKDIKCLNFLLTWLFNFLKDHPNLNHDFFVSNDQLIQFLKSKTYEVNSTSLHSIAYQADATQLIIEGGSISSTLESLLKAGYLSININSNHLFHSSEKKLNHQNNNNANRSSNKDADCCSNNNSNNNLNSFITYCELTSFFWLKIGYYDLSKVYNEVALSSCGSLINRYSIILNLSYLNFLNGEFTELKENLNSLNLSKFNNINYTKEVFGRKLVLEIYKLLNENNLTLSNILIKKLLNQNHSNLDLNFEISYLNSIYQFKVGNLNKSNQIIKLVLHSNNNLINSNKFWFIKFNLLYCLILIKTNSSIKILTGLIKLLNLSNSYGYLVLSMECLLLIAELLIGLNQFNDAFNILTNSVHFYNKFKNLNIKSKYYQLLARCEIEMLKHKGDNMQDVQVITSHLSKAISGFQKMNNYNETKISIALQKEFVQN